MAKRERIYRKLSPSAAGPTQYSSLWLGPDHLMIVRSNGYIERYQRFQLSDIQAFTIGPSNRRENWNIFWGCVGLIALIPLIITLVEHDVPYVSASFLLVALGVITANLALGPTCKVFLVTRVQTVWLPLVRRRRAERTLAELEPLVQAAQADLTVTPEALPTSPPPVA